MMFSLSKRKFKTIKLAMLTYLTLRKYLHFLTSNQVVLQELQGHRVDMGSLNLRIESKW